VLNLSRRIEDISGCVEGGVGDNSWVGSNICSISLLPMKKREEPQLSDDPGILLVFFFFWDCKILKMARLTFKVGLGAWGCSTLVGACACWTFFPSASYTIGFASGFALHILRRMVVFPAFALPMMRMRNWGHSRRICSALKALCLNGRASIDFCVFLFAGDMAEEDERRIRRLDEGLRQTCERGTYRDNQSLLPFLDTSNAVHSHLSTHWQWTVLQHEIA